MTQASDVCPCISTGTSRDPRSHFENRRNSHHASTFCTREDHDHSKTWIAIVNKENSQIFFPYFFLVSLPSQTFQRFLGFSIACFLLFRKTFRNRKLLIETVDAQKNNGFCRTERIFETSRPVQLTYSSTPSHCCRISRDWHQTVRDIQLRSSIK